MRTAGLALAFCLLLSIGSSLATVAQAAVDANTATTVELEAITGIGPALAARIVEERRKAPFRNLDELRSRARAGGQASLR
ncbi:MAG TPA: helix-hairpin-helix domain-containing protein, partial [Burkholderiaceae bacterium]|nr:helix-hairpin-helix domain-containing protein [Burkholderiaceae bacterium]